jgi:hypothetical protein
MTQGRMDRGRPQVGVGAEKLAQGEQPGLGAAAALRRGERGVPDGPKQDRVGLPHGGRRAGRQGVVGLRHTGRPDRVFRRVEPEVEQLAAA